MEKSRYRPSGTAPILPSSTNRDPGFRNARNKFYEINSAQSDSKWENNKNQFYKEPLNAQDPHVPQHEFQNLVSI